MSLVWILLAVVSQFVVMAIFFKDSSAALIRTEPRGPNKKKKSNKTCCNQNLPVLPLSDDL